MLTLPIKKHWFDMICSGKKKEEYREIKPYWTKRFTTAGLLLSNGYPSGWRKKVILKNGYGKDAPKATVICEVTRRCGKSEWGAEEGREYYVLNIFTVYMDKTSITINKDEHN